MSERLGTRTLNGSIIERPALDVQGNSYAWNNVSLVVLRGHKDRFYLVPAGVKVSPELEAELRTEAEAERSDPAGPTVDQLREAAPPAEEVPPTRTRRKSDTTDD